MPLVTPEGQEQMQLRKPWLGDLCPPPLELNSPKNKGPSAPKVLVGVESALQHCQTTA